MSETLSKLNELLIGIDLTETDSDEGWWETSVGAEFGAMKLRQLRSLFAELEAEKQRLDLIETCSELTCEECDARTAELRARIAELEADKRRLDWLDKQRDFAFKRPLWNTAMGYSWSVISSEHDTLRAAIDAAMSTECEG